MTPKPPTEAPLKSVLDTDQFVNPDLQKFLSEVGWNIVSIRRVFLLLTRVHYSNPVNYGIYQRQFQNLVWNINPDLSTLLIDLDYDFDPTHTEKRPAIFVGTDDIMYQKVVVDNRNKLTKDGSGEEYVARGVTTVIIRHVGKTADESLAMADLTRHFFKGMRKMLMENGQLSGYEVQRITTSKPFQRSPTQADQLFEADIIIGIQFNDPWIITRESHRITHICFTGNNSIANYIQIA